MWVAALGFVCCSFTGMQKPDSSLQAIGRSVDVHHLGELSRVSPEAAIREGALERLVELAISHDDGATSLEAVKEVADEDALARIVRLSRHRDTRSNAVSKVSRPRLLYALAEQAEDLWVRRAAARRLDDDFLLARLALTSSDYEVRRLAIRSIDDPAVLEGVARESPDGEYAVAGIDDAEALAVLAITARTSSTRSSAVKMLSDPNRLEEVVWNRRHAGVAIEALKKLSDDEALQRVVTDHPSADVRVAAVRRVQDAAFLEVAALGNPHYRVRKAAAARLGDPAVAMRIVRDDREYELVRAAAVEAVKDPDALFDLARTHACVRVRVAAVKRLKSVNRLVEVANADTAWEVRVEAVRTLRRKPSKPGADLALVALATSGLHADVRRWVLDDVSDPALLERIKKNDSDPTVRARAHARLDRLEGRQPFGVGFLVGYRYGRPLGHEGSFGFLLGNARTRWDEPTSAPVPVLPGAGGTGWLVQAVVTGNGLKLSAGFAQAGMLYLPPLSMGWSVKGSYLFPFAAVDRLEAGGYVGLEVEAAYLITVSVGAFRATDGSGATLVTVSAGVGF
jgi:hypothetical protein